MSSLSATQKSASRNRTTDTILKPTAPIRGAAFILLLLGFVLNARRNLWSVRVALVKGLLFFISYSLIL
jgi:hypothetical protein